MSESIQRWRRVEDELPEILLEVIVWVDEPSEEPYGTSARRFQNGKYWNGELGFLPDGAVKAWMPMPSFPE